MRAVAWLVRYEIHLRLVGNIDFVALCARALHRMIAMESALSYWDLTDEIPSTVHLAVPIHGGAGAVG